MKLPHPVSITTGMAFLAAAPCVAADAKTVVHIVLGASEQTYANVSEEFERLGCGRVVIGTSKAGPDMLTAHDLHKCDQTALASLISKLKNQAYGPFWALDITEHR